MATEERLVRGQAVAVHGCGGLVAAAVTRSALLAPTVTTAQSVAVAHAGDEEEEDDDEQEARAQHRDHDEEAVASGVGRSDGR